MILYKTKLRLRHAIETLSILRFQLKRAALHCDNKELSAKIQVLQQLAKELETETEELAKTEVESHYEQTANAIIRAPQGDSE